MYFSTKRQQFLIDQGYAYEVITEIPGLDPYAVLPKEKEQDLLASVLAAIDVCVASSRLTFAFLFLRRDRRMCCRLSSSVLLTVSVVRSLYLETLSTA